MTTGLRAPPKTGWAKLVPELLVSDIGTSIEFWCNQLGFAIAYQRPEEKFIYLERPEGAQIMLSQRSGKWETGLLDRPYGRGTMFQVYVTNIEPVERSLEAAGWPLYAGPREMWRKVGDRRSGQREIFVLDPDGYLVMVAHDLGYRLSFGRAGAGYDPVCRARGSVRPAPGDRRASGLRERSACDPVAGRADRRHLPGVTAPIGVIAVQTGTLVKQVRVLSKEMVTAPVTRVPALATTRILTPSPNAAIATIVSRLAAVAAAARASCGNSPAEPSVAKPRKPTTNQGTNWCSGGRPCAGRLPMVRLGAGSSAFSRRRFANSDSISTTGPSIHKRPVRNAPTKSPCCLPQTSVSPPCCPGILHRCNYHIRMFYN
jgi:hypothetical protein